MSFTQKDLTRTDGAKNMGGILNKAYYCLAADIATFPDVAAAITTLETAAVIATNITCKVGKKFNEIYCTTGKGAVNDEMVGEKDGHSFMNKFKAFFPGTKAEALGAAAAFANSHLVFIVPQAGVAGEKRVVGSPKHPAEIIMSSITSAETSDGLKGWSFEFEAPSETPAPIYSGEIPLTEAV